MTQHDGNTMTQHGGNDGNDSDETYDSDYEKRLENGEYGYASDDGFETPEETAAAPTPMMTPKRSTSAAPSGPPNLKAKRARLQREAPRRRNEELDRELEQERDGAALDTTLALLKAALAEIRRANTVLVTIREFQLAVASDVS
jgi:hypothetical protein